MIRSLEIESYRGFGRFSMKGLKRINLLVGTNNSGKTSLLEALLLLSSGGDPATLWSILSRRGERLQEGGGEIDVCHLFHGHELKAGARFSIRTERAGPDHFVKCVAQEIRDIADGLLSFPPDGEQAIPGMVEGEQISGPRLELFFEGSPEPAYEHVPLSESGGLNSDTMRRLTRSRPPKEGASEAQFVSTESLSVTKLLSLWNGIVLTPAEDGVVDALKILEPKIERIAAMTGDLRLMSPRTRGGFMLRLRETPVPIPIGSMGDGAWRILALAIALSQSRNGLLLIDEIDTGLHYTVMAKMWNLVDEMARKLNVQVFATTHSYDCVKGLAAICDGRTGEDEISIQRIEPDEGRAVSYTESEIKIAAERGIEVR